MNYFKEIYELHKKQLSYLDLRHRATLICFAGIPGSGKTYLAKLLEERYKAVRISNDNLREIIKQIKSPEEDKEEILREYVIDLLSRVPFSNKRIIIDSGIERKYIRIKETAEKNNIPIYIIALEVSRDELEARISQRPKQDRKHFHSEIERWTQEYNKFMKDVGADFVIKDTRDKSLQDLYSWLDSKIT
jgi:predicted kinase